jgi:hypothetical protein
MWKQQVSRMPLYTDFHDKHSFISLQQDESWDTCEQGGMIILTSEPVMMAQTLIGRRKDNPRTHFI